MWWLLNKNQFNKPKMHFNVNLTRENSRGFCRYINSVANLEKKSRINVTIGNKLSVLYQLCTVIFGVACLWWVLFSGIWYLPAWGEQSAWMVQWAARQDRHMVGFKPLWQISTLCYITNADLLYKHLMLTVNLSLLQSWGTQQCQCPQRIRLMF